MGIITVDDTNTVFLSYDNKWFHGNWTDFSTQPPSNQSLLSSNLVTAQMVLRFPSPGTGFSYFGMMRSGGGSFRLCIDCDPNQPAGPFITVDALNRTDNGHNPPALLYSKQDLTNDIHTVVLMNTNDTRVHPQGSSQITVDRFEITVQDPANVTVTGSATGGPATSSSVPSSGGSTASVDPGLIAGVVIGTLGLLALLVGLGLCWRQKRRSMPTTHIENGLVTRQLSRDPYAPDPLIIPQPERRHHVSPVSSSTTTATKGAIPRSPDSAPLSPTIDGSTLASSSNTTASSSAPRPRVERDAGPAPTDEDTLPPDYAQVFNSGPEVGPPVGVSSDAAQAAQGSAKPS